MIKGIIITIIALVFLGMFGDVLYKMWQFACAIFCLSMFIPSNPFKKDELINDLEDVDNLN